MRLAVCRGRVWRSESTREWVEMDFCPRRGRRQQTGRQCGVGASTAVAVMGLLESTEAARGRVICLRRHRSTSQRRRLAAVRLVSMVMFIPSRPLLVELSQRDGRVAVAGFHFIIPLCPGSVLSALKLLFGETASSCGLDVLLPLSIGLTLHVCCSLRFHARGLLEGSKRSSSQWMTGTVVLVKHSFPECSRLGRLVLFLIGPHCV